MIKPWQNPRSEFWWFRRRVQRQYLKFGMPAEIKFSLETKDRDETVLRCQQENLTLERQWRYNLVGAADLALASSDHGARRRSSFVAGLRANWVRGMKEIDHAVWPNHNWRHRWKAVARHVEMYPEISDFITGHGGGSVSKRYGPRWAKTFAMRSWRGKSEP